MAIPDDDMDKQYTVWGRDDKSPEKKLSSYDSLQDAKNHGRKVAHTWVLVKIKNEKHIEQWLLQGHFGNWQEI